VNSQETIGTYKHAINGAQNAVKKLKVLKKNSSSKNKG